MKRGIYAENVTGRRVLLSDFSGGLSMHREEHLLPMRFAAECYNFDTRDGALSGKTGFAKLYTHASNITKSYTTTGMNKAAFLFRRYDYEAEKQADIIVVQSATGYMYAYETVRDGSRALNLYFSEIPETACYRLNGEDVFLMSTEREGLYVWDGVNNPYLVEDAPAITSMCVHYERLFVTTGGDRSSVWFSDDFDVTNWNVSLDEGGFIQLADEGGPSNRVVSFADYVYVFRSNGIARLTAYAEQESFRVSRLYVGAGCIYPQSVAVCGDRILFMASDGLYAFDGWNAVRIAEGLDGLFDVRYSKFYAAYQNGCYYLCCRLKRDNPAGVTLLDNNSIVRYHLESRSMLIYRGTAFSHVSALNFAKESFVVFGLPKLTGCNYLCTEGSDGTFAGTEVGKLWRTPDTDLNLPDRVKTVRYLFLYADGPVEVEISSERGSKTVSFTGDGLERRPVNLRGRSFTFEFRCAGDATISKPEIYYQYGR